MEQAAFVFVGSILLMFTFIVITIGILIINNLFHRYWKPFTIYSEVEHHQLPPQEPTLRKDEK
jgi:hypothetical protein